MNKIMQELENTSFFNEWDIASEKKMKSPFDLILKTNKETRQLVNFKKIYKIDPMIYNISEGLFRSLPLKEKGKIHEKIYKNIKENKSYYFLWYSLVIDLLFSLIKKRNGQEKEVAEMVLDLYLKEDLRKNEVINSAKKLEEKKPYIDIDFFYLMYCIIMSKKDDRHIKLFFEMSFLKKEKREKLALYYSVFIIKELESSNI